LEFAVYGAKTYLNRNRHQDWANHRWIALDGPQHQRAALTRLGVPESHIAANTFPVACAHCEGALGLAILPRFIGDTRPGLKALDIDLTAFGSEMWLLAHPDVYKTARVKSVFQMLLEGLAPDGLIWLVE
jgi:DNA-binding transcriptional LysR family regulator